MSTAGYVSYNSSYFAVLDCFVLFCLYPSCFFMFPDCSSQGSLSCEHRIIHDPGNTVADQTIGTHESSRPIVPSLYNKQPVDYHTVNSEATPSSLEQTPPHPWATAAATAMVPSARLNAVCTVFSQCRMPETAATRCGSNTLFALPVTSASSIR